LVLDGIFGLEQDFFCLGTEQQRENFLSRPCLVGGQTLPMEIRLKARQIWIFLHFVVLK